MEKPEIPQLKEYNAKKLIGISALVLTVLLAAGVFYAYSRVDINDQETSFNTNATVFNPNSSNGTLEAGIATGQGMSFGRFNAAFNKTKTLNLSAPRPTLLEVETEGNISSRLSYEERHYFTGRKQIDVEMAGNETGFYNGSITLDMQTAENKWGERWLELLYKYF